MRSFVKISKQKLFIRKWRFRAFIQKWSFREMRVHSEKRNERDEKRGYGIWKMIDIGIGYWVFCFEYHSVLLILQMFWAELNVYTEYRFAANVFWTDITNLIYLNYCYWAQQFSFKTKLGTGLGKAYSVFCLSRFKGIISVAISAYIIILIATF